MEIQTFDPVKFSNAENEFLLETLGLPTAVALRQLKYPVNPKAVKPILDRVNELEDLRKYDGSDWVGVEKLKQSIRKWQEQNIKWANDFKRSGKRAGSHLFRPRWRTDSF
jgi:hypothetical protein